MPCGRQHIPKKYSKTLSRKPAALLDCEYVHEEFISDLYGRLQQSEICFGFLTGAFTRDSGRHKRFSYAASRINRCRAKNPVFFVPVTALKRAYRVIPARKNFTFKVFVDLEGSRSSFVYYCCMPNLSLLASIGFLSFITLFLLGCTAPVVSEPGTANSSSSGIFTQSSPVTYAWTRTEIATGLSIPWDIAVDRDGSLFVTERSGTILKITTDGSNNVVAAVQNVVMQGESGLTGLTLDPDFTSNHYIYVCYSYAEDGQINNRISRFTLTDRGAVDEKILIDALPGGSRHNGARLRFGPDGKLWVLTGDAGGNGMIAQDPQSLGGKVLRVNADGSVPADNPIPGSLVYSLGHRNPQGLAWNASDALFVSEHGNSAHDEINRIMPNANYGWPLDQYCEAEHGTPPVFCAGTTTWAPSGLAFLPSSSLHGLPDSFFVANLRGSTLMRLEERNGQLLPAETVIDGIGRLRAVTAAPDGSLYVSTSNRDGRGTVRDGDDKILKLTLAPVQ